MEVESEQEGGRKRVVAGEEVREVPRTCLELSMDTNDGVRQRKSSCARLHSVVVLLRESRGIKQGRVESKRMDDLKVCRLPYGAARFLAPLKEGNARRPLSKETIALCPRVRRTLVFADPCEKGRDEGDATLMTVRGAATEVDLGAGVYVFEVYGMVVRML